MKLLLPILCLLTGLPAITNAAQAQPTRAFLEEFCTECHDSTTHKAGLNLETRPLDFSTHKDERLWTAVYDRVKDGSMPPKKADQPAQEQRDTLLRMLGGVLQEHSLSRQNKEGRVPLRRLNRTQVEDTLRDLLSLPALEVKELLPEESLVAGFDNLSNAQSISGTHLVRYQQAADKALAATLPLRPFSPIRVNLTGRQVFETPGKNEQFKRWKCWLKEDAMVIPSKLWRPYTTIANPPAPVDGRYRFRVTGYGRHTNGARLPVTFNHLLSPQLSYGKDLAWRDLPADTPGVAEVVLNLQQGQVVDIFGWTLQERDMVLRKLKEEPADTWDGPSLVLEHLEIEGPLDTWPPQSYRALFGELPLQTQSERLAETNPKAAPKPREKRSAEEWRGDPLSPTPSEPKADAERLLRTFLPKAFRRPVSEALLQHYLRVALRQFEEGTAFDEAMIETYKSALCSTGFLFFDEKPGPLDGYALAARLSYFLWNSMPDERLFTLAAAGGLSQPDTLRAEVERMLDDAKSERFTQRFAGQWLDLHKIDATTPDMKLYPEFDRILMESSVRETTLFFEEVLRHNRSVLEFVHSDWTFLNSRLAQHYGLTPEKHLGHELEKVVLPPDSHRGGVITHASVLKVTANGASTSPILRGKWICERILGIDPPPPPKDVPAVEPDTRGATTIRQQLAQHRSTEACNGCHALIDPPGFALESYDVIGGWREFYRASLSTGKTGVLPHYNNRRVNRGPNVEIGDRLPDGRPFADVEEYKRLILEDPDALAHSLVRRVLMFATGGEIQFADREVIEQIVSRLRAKNYGLRSLIHEVVQSRPFQNK
jgi:PAS domain-containing protein